MSTSRFPQKIADIIIIAQKMLAGMSANEGVFVQCPIIPKELMQLIDYCVEKLNDLVALNAALKSAVKEKDTAVENLLEAMKRVAKFAENTNDPEENLHKIGLTGRRAHGTGELPGRTSSLIASASGPGWLSLLFQKPEKGGPVTQYIIEWRAFPSGKWEFLYAAYTTQANLVGLPLDAAYEYRVFARNAAGDGEASNAIMVTLKA